MIVLVCGGRDYQNWHRVHAMLDGLHSRFEITKIVQGAARGADFHAWTWARNNGVEHTGNEYKPDWDTHGKVAGILRNAEMFDAERPDLVIGFPGDNGTAHMVSYAASANTPTMRVPDFDFEAIGSVAVTFDELDDALEGEVTIREPMKPYWLCAPVKSFPRRQFPIKTPVGRYESLF